eukprot:COSAG06_NODE_11868_length_1454_cov_0.999262_2_plen_126_part_00
MHFIFGSYHEISRRRRGKLPCAAMRCARGGSTAAGGRAGGQEEKIAQLMAAKNAAVASYDEQIGAAVSRVFCACIGSPCLRQCVHGAETVSPGDGLTAAAAVGVSIRCGHGSGGSPPWSNSGCKR